MFGCLVLVAYSVEYSRNMLVFTRGWCLNGGTMKVPSREQFSKAVIAIIMMIVAALVTLGAFFWQNFDTSRIITPTNFKECVAAAGSRIQETYPEVCVTEDGDRFVNPDQKVTPVE